MSASRNSDVPTRSYKNIKKLRDANVVKSLVVEYENVLSQVKRDVKKMGADQSAVKPTSNDSSFVKQRIEKFNQIENEFKKTTRSVSTYGNTINNSEFQRSKSVDVIRKKYNQTSEKSSLKDSKENVSNKTKPNKSFNKQKRTDNKYTKKPPRRNIELSSISKTSSQDSLSYTLQNATSKKAIEKNKNSDVCIQTLKKEIDEDNNTKEEFDKIESQLQDATKVIYELTENPSVFTSSVQFFITNKHDTTVEETNHNDSHCDDRESIENVDIYMHDQDLFDNDSENEFGEISKNNLINVDFIEAYNQVGNELLMTTIQSVEETFIDDNKPEPTDIVLNVPKAFDDNEEKPVVEDNREEHILNGIDNRHYFSKEELEILVPDDDYEFHEPSKTTKSNAYRTPKNYLNSTSEENIAETQNIAVIKSYPDTIKSETTIYDSFQNPRIAKIRSITKREEFIKDNLLKDDNESNKTLETKPKIKYIIEELVDTEKNYIDHLESVLEDYMPYFRSNNLAPRNTIKTLFGNIKEIYQLTQKLYKTLRGCSNYDGIASTFLRYEPLFKMYPLYFKNKPIADQYLLGEFKEIISIRERELNDQLGLASHLLTPIQRLGKYILFLEQMNKELKKNGVTSDLVVTALNMVKKEMTTGNDYIAVDSIKKSPIGLVQQGSFLMREKFKVLKPKKYEAVIFFFEKLIVFTTVHPKSSEIFLYKDSIKLDEMGIRTYDDDPLTIELKRFPSGTSKEPEELNLYLIEAKREKDKKQWTEEIEKRLWDQLNQCRERQQLLYNCVRKKHIFENTPNQTPKKKTGRK